MVGEARSRCIGAVRCSEFGAASSGQRRMTTGMSESVLRPGPRRRSATGDAARRLGANRRSGRPSRVYTFDTRSSGPCRGQTPRPGRRCLATEEGATLKN